MWALRHGRARRIYSFKLSSRMRLARKSMGHFLRGFFCARGFTATEVLVAAVAASLLSVLLLVLLFQERDTETRARLEYVTLLAARDEMYEARILTAAGAKPESLDHPFRHLGGGV